MAWVPFGGRRSLLSSQYICQQICNCFRLFRHCVVLALALARASAGRSIAARMALMAMTTNSSIRVNPERSRSPGRDWNRTRSMAAYPLLWRINQSVKDVRAGRIDWDGDLSRRAGAGNSEPRVGSDQADGVALKTPAKVVGGPTEGQLGAGRRERQVGRGRVDQMMLRDEVGLQGSDITAGNGRAGDDEFGHVARQTEEAVGSCAEVQRLSGVEAVALVDEPADDWARSAGDAVKEVADVVACFACHQDMGGAKGRTNRGGRCGSRVAVAAIELPAVIGSGDIEIIRRRYVRVAADPGLGYNLAIGPAVETRKVHQGDDRHVAGHLKRG